MSIDLNELIARKDKLEGELNHELSADYNELMKKMSQSFSRYAWEFSAIL